MPDARQVTIYLPKKSSLEKVASILEANKVIPSAVIFKWVVRFKRAASRIKSGEYIFYPERSPATVFKVLVEGKTVQHFITFPEGLGSREIADLLKNAPYMEGTLKEIPPEGSLLPETYAYTYGDERSTILKRMQDALHTLLHRLWEQRQTGLPFKNPGEALVLASIVEKETALPLERPRIAAVFINRLKQHMPLQSDPTVIYALELIEKRPLLRSLTMRDLQQDHPFNTYRIPALPPSPICNPGKASLEAVLHPMDTDDLFFVADGTGGHVFSKTLKQHQIRHHEWRTIRKNPGLKKSSPD